MNDIFGKELNVGDSVVIMFGIPKKKMVYIVSMKVENLFKIIDLTQDVMEIL